ncbi:MAG: hypothetical protein DWQ02_05330 [Bacteroidetes bacterium]|nr:MAG: hypothetical protein DWQ02_05330 [Bacteroidota bacterium]
MNEEKKCIVCQSTSQQMPILEFAFKGQKLHVCSQHIPIIIHQPDKLQHLLPDLPNRPGEHDD